MLNLRRTLPLRRNTIVNAEASVLAAFQTWVNTINSRQPSAVSRLYSDDAVFFPTLSFERISGRMDRATYFARLLGRSGFVLRVLEMDVQLLGEVGVCSGLYEFEYSDRGEATNLEARFTMVFQRIGTAYFIVNHHSSRVP